jgi:hypothetical protein
LTTITRIKVKDSLLMVSDVCNDEERSRQRASKIVLQT